MQIILGMINAGAFIKFISPSVISGFTSAVAILIGLSQLGNFLGISLSSQSQLYPILRDLTMNLGSVHLATFFIGILSLVVLIGGRELTTRFPFPFLVVVLGISAVVLFDLDEKGVGIVGEVPKGFPDFSFPVVDLYAMQMLVPTSLTIALIAMMESLAITKTLAAKDSPPLNVNKELRAIGFANAVGSLFSSYTVTGSFSRSAVNHRAGAVSQVSAIVTALGVLLTLAYLTPLFYYLPKTVLAAIILSAVFGLINIGTFKNMLRIKPSDGWVWLVTFVATLLVGIQWGLLIGVGFSLCILIDRISHPYIAELGLDEKSRMYRDIEHFPKAKLLPNTLIIRVDARRHFSNVDYFNRVVERKIQKARKDQAEPLDIIIDMAGVNDIDTMGIEALENLMKKYHNQEDTNFWLVQLKGGIRELLQRAEWEQRFPDAQAHNSLEKLIKEREKSVEYMI
ncbi:SulP family inorganic anion transporter [Planococcus lenghuensis]|uniref:SulP family inorganic anion transporter n=1 Tax=Planococcus lenghuensis TaxID=2213202 RepID=UPI0022B67E92|nr:SulP family inorganic anion transporter [Planococcus lenghuensis]